MNNKKKNTSFILLLIYYIIGIVIAIINYLAFKSNILSTIVFVMALTGCFLNMRRKSQAFIFFTLQVLLYGIVSFISAFYGEAIINIIYLVPLYFLKVINSFKQKEEGNELEIKSISLKSFLLIIVAIAFITVGYGFILQAINSEMPFLNSLATALCIFASLMTAKQYKEQWFLWVILNIVWIVMWGSTLLNNNDNLPLVIQNIMLLPINVIGLITWYKKKKETSDEEKNNI